MTLEDIIDFPLLSRFLDKLLNKLRVCINGDIWIGAGNTVNDVQINANKYSDVALSAIYSMTCSNNYIFVIVPTSIIGNITLKMSGIEVPVDTSTTTINDKSYTIIQSKDKYTGSFKLQL